MNKEDRIGDASTLSLWKDLRSQLASENWCCSAIKDSGIEFLPIEESCPDFIMHRIKVNFCPHCGQRLNNDVTWGS